MVNGYADIYKDNALKHLRTHTMSNRRSIITTGLNYFAYLCCRSSRNCPQWLSNRRLRLSKLQAITVNVTIGIVFCVDWHDSYTWLSTVCPAITCKDFMRLYEYIGWSESSLDLLVILGFDVHRLIYSCGARRFKRRLWYTSFTKGGYHIKQEKSF